jgi:hypothetical protein
LRNSGKYVIPLAKWFRYSMLQVVIFTAIYSKLLSPLAPVTDKLLVPSYALRINNNDKEQKLAINMKKLQKKDY